MVIEVLPFRFQISVKMPLTRLGDRSFLSISTSYQCHSSRVGLTRVAIAELESTETRRRGSLSLFLPFMVIADRTCFVFTGVPPAVLDYSPSTQGQTTATLIHIIDEYGTQRQIR